MLRLICALGLSVMVAVLLALGITYLDGLPESGEAVSAAYPFTIR